MEGVLERTIERKVLYHFLRKEEGSIIANLTLQVD